MLVLPDASVLGITAHKPEDRVSMVLEEQVAPLLRSRHLSPSCPLSQLPRKWVSLWSA